MNTRTELINYLIKKNNFKTYLEIGIGNGSNFNKIDCELKDACDPYESTTDGCCKEVITYNMTSDEMFKKMDESKTYDVIFIDGLHKGEQVLKDISNALKHISKDGYILIHDSLPSCEQHACFPRGKQIHWNGSVYKAYPTLLDDNIAFEIINMDEGIGVIKGDQAFKTVTLQESEMSYKDIFKSDFNYEKEFNIISIKDFLTIC